MTCVETGPPGGRTQDGITSGGRRSRSRRLTRVTICASLLLVACGSGGGSGSSSSGGGPLVIANFDPFSGPNAPYGAFEQAGCTPAVNVINAQGGVLGHTLTCQIVDDRGDPADAVPAAQKLLATTPNLVAVVDQNSGLLTATTPIFDGAHIPELSIGGDIPFDTNHFQYFWRTIPGDDVAGYAVTAYIKNKTPYSNVAAMFTTDQSAQGNVPGVQGGVKNLHLTLAVNEGLAIDQTSYNTEIQRMLAAHPDVMTMECDPQTAGVFFGQLKQAGGLLPTVLTSGTIGADWDKAAIAAIGAADFQKNFVRITQYAPSSGPAYEIFKTALLGLGRQGQADLRGPDLLRGPVRQRDHGRAGDARGQQHRPGNVQPVHRQDRVGQHGGAHVRRGQGRAGRGQDDRLRRHRGQGQLRQVSTTPAACGPRSRR